MRLRPSIITFHLPTFRRDTIYRVRAFVLLLLAAFLFCAGSVRGQEGTNSVVYFEVDYEVHDLEFVQDFSQTFDRYLEDENISPIFITSSEAAQNYPHFWENPTLHLRIRRFGQFDGIFAGPYITEDLLSSSMLMASYPRDSALMLVENSQTSLGNVHRMLLSLSQYELRDYSSAMANLNHLLDSNLVKIDNRWIEPSLTFYAANCALETGDYEKAQRLYEEILNMQPELEYSWSAAVNLAWIYLQNDNEIRASELMDNVIDSLTNANDFFLDLALTRRSRYFALTGRFDEAIADMDAAIELEPDNPSLYVERGQRILLLYEWDRALADYNHAIELDPTYADAYYYRGILYASVPEGFDARAEAIADFQHYLDLAAPLGRHTEDAQRYLTEIQAQLDAVSD